MWRSMRGGLRRPDKILMPDQARATLDASGLLVTPGMIDLHVHVFPMVSYLGVDPDSSCLARGSTTVVDAGSAGADTFDAFRHWVIDVSATDILAWGYPFNRSYHMFSAWRIPRAGKHYPGSVGEFQAWFRTDADCLDYLEWLRWPDGFVCPSCGHEGGWRLGDGRFMCPACSTRSSVTAGTIFDRTRDTLDDMVHRLLAVRHR